jgi:stage II sporulation protein AA (anti-sigma F factor antagonist)
MADGYFQISSTAEAQIISLRLPTAIDNHDFDRLNEELLAAFDTRRDGAWVLDVSGVAYMGSSVLGLLVNIRQRVLQSGGELILCGLSPGLLRIFRTCCMERLFQITRNQADALRMLR